MTEEQDRFARFGMLATAISGRPLAVTGIDGRAWTDGRTLFLDSSEEPRRQVIAMSAMVGAGSLDGEILKGLTGRRRLTHRYLSIEGRRALSQFSERFPFAHVPDCELLPQDVITYSPLESLTVARSKTHLPEPPAWFGDLRPRQVDVEAEQDLSDTPLLGRGEKEPEEQDQLGEANDVRITAEAKSRVGPLGDSSFARRLQRLFGTSQSSSSTPYGTEVRTGRGALRKSNRGGQELVDPDAVAVPIQSLANPAGIVYPEWDEQRRLYRPQWCTVVEWSPAPDELAPLDRPAHSPTLRRELGRLGLGLRRTRAQQDGHDLDLDAAISAQISRTAGHDPTHLLYVNNRRQNRDLSVLVLLDASGSGDERSESGESLFALQRRAAAALVDTLAGFGDRLAAYAFRSEGQIVHYTHLKRFDEPFDTGTLHRIGGVQPFGFTRFGGAIRHATHLLSSDGATLRKLLIVLSDGFPFDHGYEGSYAEADTRKALDEARVSGVGCLCLNLGSSIEPEGLARVYGRTEHASALDLDSLAPRMLKLFHGALRTADLRRRYGPDGVPATRQRRGFQNTHEAHAPQPAPDHPKDAATVPRKPA